MSLLIDVLRKAEEARRTPDTQPPQHTAVTRGIELEPLNIEAGSTAPGPPPAAPPPDEAPVAGPLTTQHNTYRAPPHWLLGCAALGAAVTMASWIWLEAQATTWLDAQPTVPPAQTPPSPTSTGDSPPAPQEAAPHPIPPSPGARIDNVTTSTPDEVPPRFRPGTPPAADTPHLALHAHEAYTAGDLVLAQTLYRQALHNDPANLEAVDGLGAIALQQGLPEQAEILFRHALLLNPHDPVALAGLIQTSNAESRHAETRLRNSLNAHPDAIATRIALGDTLASQQRWAEAQQAYFQAHTLAPQEPDIAYNLAVSLDHLGQQHPAALYYRKALELAARHPARFSHTHGEARLHALLSREPGP